VLPLNLRNYSYGGPTSLKNHVLVHLPYESSTMELFENWAQGVVYLIPTVQMYYKIMPNYVRFCCVVPNDPLTLDESNDACDWWHVRYRALFIYWDSLEELKSLSENQALIDEKRTQIADFMKVNQITTAKTWHSLVYSRLK